MNPYHTSVLLSEVIQGLAVQPGSWYVDGTLGGGGYTVALLQEGARVLGIDRDLEALVYVRNILEANPHWKENEDWMLIHNNYGNIREIVEEKKKHVQGIVLDLGVSSYQLDTEKRGFSYRSPDSPLDLRMDQTSGFPASDIIQNASEEELYEIIARYGEEERARSIAARIFRTRHITPIQTTGRLVEIIAASVPKNEQDRAVTRVFQALRIRVNDELGSLKKVLNEAVLLPKGGRFAVVSFHSLEDRIVKQSFRSPIWKEVGKQPIRPTEAEIQRNKRSRSAKLRVVERL